jgi:hypothetical protein
MGRDSSGSILKFCLNFLPPIAKVIETDFVATDFELSARYNRIEHGINTGSITSMRDSKKLCFIAVMEAPLSHREATVLSPIVTLRQPLTSKIGSILPSVLFSCTSIASIVAVFKGDTRGCCWEKHVEWEVC